MKNLFNRYGIYADPKYLKIAWVLMGLVALILAGGAPTGPAGPGGGG